MTAPPLVLPQASTESLLSLPCHSSRSIFSVKSNQSSPSSSPTTATRATTPSKPTRGRRAVTQIAWVSALVIFLNVHYFFHDLTVWHSASTREATSSSTSASSSSLNVQKQGALEHQSTQLRKRNALVPDSNTITATVKTQAPNQPQQQEQEQQDAVPSPTTTLLQQPFYVYEDLIWLNATLTVDTNSNTKEESIADLIARRYLWKHNDDMWFLHAALHHPMRVHDPAQAKLFVVPTLINLVMSARLHRNFCVRGLQIKNGTSTTTTTTTTTLCGLEMLEYANTYLATQSPWFQRSQGRDHVVVATTHSAPTRIAHLESLLKCNVIAVEDSQWNHPQRYSLPSYYVGSPCPPTILDPQNKMPKKADFAMIATMKNRPTFDDRRNVCSWTQKDRPHYSWTVCGSGDQCPALAQAKFGFHVRGDTYGANRLIDTLLSGTVPIFTRREQYNVLPDWIDWSQLSYFADLSNRTAFVKSLDAIVADTKGYQARIQAIAQQAPILFDWTRTTTAGPFDAYMYQLARQLFPEAQRIPISSSNSNNNNNNKNIHEEYPALLLAPPYTTTTTTIVENDSDKQVAIAVDTHFRAFEPSVKTIWCGDSGPAHHCGECGSLYDSERLGCSNMCVWCEYGLADPNQSADGRWWRGENGEHACAPSHYKCAEPDKVTFLQHVVRPFRKPRHIGDDGMNNICFDEASIEPNDKRVRGFVLANTFGAAPYTATAVTKHIAARVAHRRPDGPFPSSSSCLHFTSHTFSRLNHFAKYKTSTVRWTVVREPTARVTAALARYRPKDALQFMQGQKNHQLDQLRTRRWKMAAKADQPTSHDVPETYVDLTPVFQDELLNAYHFVAVAERMEESLVAMKLVWGLRDGDIVVPMANREPDYGWIPTARGVCTYVKKLERSDSKVTEYLESEFAPHNHDYDLHEWANRSLDQTIEQLGRERVESEIQRHRALKALVLEKCHWTGPCSDNGKWQPLDMECIHKVLDKYEARNNNKAPVDLAS